jgi:hypothetical protein
MGVETSNLPAPQGVLGQASGFREFEPKIVAFMCNWCIWSR